MRQNKHLTHFSYLFDAKLPHLVILYSVPLHPDSNIYLKTKTSMKQKLIRLMLLVAAFLMLGNLQAAKKVHTIGDSTMANYDENTETKRGWGMYFGNFLTNGWESVNYAKGGRDSRSGYNELWQNAKNNVQAGDYVIIQFAHNDQMYNGVDNLELQAYYPRRAMPPMLPP